MSTIMGTITFWYITEIQQMSYFNPEDVKPIVTRGAGYGALGKQGLGNNIKNEVDASALVSLEDK